MSSGGSRKGEASVVGMLKRVDGTDADADGKGCRTGEGAEEDGCAKMEWSEAGVFVLFFECMTTGIPGTVYQE
jgi:hypothetical protein